MKKTLVIGLTSVLLFTVGCSSTKNEVATEKETSNNTIEQPQPQEIDAKEIKLQEKQYIINNLSIISKFISEQSGRLSLYLNNGDRISAMSYANGLSYNEDRAQADKNMSFLSSKVTLPESKMLAEEVALIYFDFMRILEMTAEGNFNEEYNKMTRDLGDKLEIVTEMVVNY